MGAAAQILLVMMLYGSAIASVYERADASSGNLEGSRVNANSCVIADKHAEADIHKRTDAVYVSAVSLPADRYRVRASDHRAFWLWSGVGSSAEMREAEVVYLHQGEVNLYRGRPVFERVGLPVSRLSFPRIWLTVRLTTLDLPEEIVARIHHSDGALESQW